MDIGIGLPSTIPGVIRDELLEWARRADDAGFSSLATLDRLAYDNLEPLVALGAAASPRRRSRRFPSTADATIGGVDPARMLGVRVARALYARWRTLAPAARERLAPLAEDAKRAALDARGASDSETAQDDVRSTSQTLAAAIVESAEADPELDDIEVRRLREDLKRELDRLSSAEIRASRNVVPREPQ